MNKMLVTTFASEEDAYKGLDALKELDEKSDITLYATAVISKDNDGNVTIKQGADSGPLSTATGILAGTLVGLVGGPVGAVVGATTGGIAGSTVDLTNAGMGIDFLDEIAESLVPGKTALIADIDEDWQTPVDTKFNELNGVTIRPSRYQVIEDQLVEDSTNAERELNRIKTESEAKINKLQAQLKEAKEEQKAKIEARIASIKEAQEQRSEKLLKVKESVQDVFES